MELDFFCLRHLQWTWEINFCFLMATKTSSLIFFYIWKVGIWNRDLGISLAFEARVFPYFENVVVWRTQNKPWLLSFRQTLLHHQQLLGFSPIALAPWSFPGTTALLALAPSVHLRCAAVQLPLRPSGNPLLGPEWLSPSFIYAHVYTFLFTNKY